MLALSKRQQLPTVLPDQSPSPQQRTHSSNSDGPTALPLQNKGGLHQNVFMADRLSVCLLARLRAGHTPLLKAYANQLDTTVDPKCPSCGEEPETVEHWLQRCPNAVAQRQKLFGEPSPPLSVLTTNPGSMLALASKTLLYGP